MSHGTAIILLITYLGYQAIQVSMIETMIVTTHKPYAQYSCGIYTAQGPLNTIHE